jgi:hypothetical protein
MAAINGNRSDVVKDLIMRGADVNIKGPPEREDPTSLDSRASSQTQMDWTHSLSPRVTTGELL